MAKARQQAKDRVQKVLLRVLQQFPGLVTLPSEQFRSLVNDEHVLLHGEIKRWGMLCRLIDRKREEFTRVGSPPAVVHRDLLRVIHRFFVGELTDEHRTTAPMYHGSLASFEEDERRWVAACRDVEAMYEYLLTYLPKQLRVRGKRVRLHERLGRPDIVRSCADVLDLIELVRWHDDERVRHYARNKLTLAQFCFEARAEGYAADRLQREVQDLEGFITRTVFGGDVGEDIDIVADLDPAQRYACRDWKIVARGKAASTGFQDRFVISTKRRHIVLPSGRRIEAYFSIRSKQHMVLKALVKDIRFLNLMGIGDAIAMRFTVSPDDLDEFVRYLRKIIVPCPGQVCDQGSSIGYRGGKTPLDPRNAHSSKSYEAMKYIARIAGQAVEVQIVPMRSWIDSVCKHDRVNHACYKLHRYLDEVMPILFPEHLFGVPWESPVVQRQAMAHIFATKAISNSA